MRVSFLVVSACLSVSLLTMPSARAAAQGGGATLDWMVKAFGDGRHNAFTDLVQWRGAYYVCFRNGQSHGSMDGTIRVLRSADLKHWEPCGTLDTFGDDRDPHFAVKDDTLFVYFGVWDLRHDPGHGTPGRGAVRSHVATTRDGTTWAAVQGVYEPGWWLWRVEVHDGLFYSAAYQAFRPKPAHRELRLLRSVDGVAWEFVSTIANEGDLGESAMWFPEDGGIAMITRSGRAPGHAVFSRSTPGLDAWNLTPLNTLVHSPATVVWRGRRFVAGRGQRDGEWVTRLWEYADGALVEGMTLPSAGDTSYPGLLVDPASEKEDAPALFISWYSQHDDEREPGSPVDPASIYVGRVVVTP
ncbi:MAG: exo-alpha-sialidase [Candidatus Hydrogenedentes bacterium]|nr:exo-alpha-sialidase [Candidatus Hydrogenedentota bacterium]